MYFQFWFVVMNISSEFCWLVFHHSSDNSVLSLNRTKSRGAIPEVFIQNPVSHCCIISPVLSLLKCEHLTAKAQMLLSPSAVCEKLLVGKEI